MSLVVTDAEGLLDHPGYSRSRPYLSVKPVVLCSLGEQTGDPGKLCFGQPRGRTGRRMMAKGLDPAAFPGSPHPLAHRSLAHTQGLADIVLLPALLLQFPGTEATTFLPVFRFDRRCDAHAPSLGTPRTKFTNLCSGQ